MGCKPLRKWAAKWPQGLDLLLKASQHAKAQTILQFFLEVLQASGTTHEQQLRKKSLYTVPPQLLNHNGELRSRKKELKTASNTWDQSSNSIRRLITYLDASGHFHALDFFMIS